MPSTETSGRSSAEQPPAETLLIEIPRVDGYSVTEDNFLAKALREQGLLSSEFLYAPFSQAQLQLFIETGSPQEFFEETIDCYLFNNDEDDPALVDVIAQRTAQGIVEYLAAANNFTAYIAIYDHKFLKHSHDRAYSFIDPETGSVPESPALMKRAAFVKLARVTLLDH